MAATDDVTLPASKHYVDVRIDDHFKLHEAEQHAVDAAYDAMSTRFDSVNEFRGQMSDQVRTFASREAVDSNKNDAERRLAELERIIAHMQGVLAIARFVGFGGLMTAVGTLIWAISRGEQM